MTLEVGKMYRIKKALFTFKEGELWTLVDKGLLAYFGEYHFVFINEKKEKRSMMAQMRRWRFIAILKNILRRFEFIKLICY